MAPRIMLVEDEQRLAHLVVVYLQREGYEVFHYDNGLSAWEAWKQERYDLVVLDIMLPGLDGWSVCRRIRKNSQVPIIMLTARGEEDDRIMGFELGADDYVVKPFSPKELVLRVKAVLKRTGHCEPSHKSMQFGRILIETESHQVRVDDSIVELTPKEFELLLFLLRHKNQVLSRDTILSNVWGYDYYGGTRTVDTHVKNLREKLFKSFSMQDLIKTIWGIGYKFEVDGNV